MDLHEFPTIEAYESGPLCDRRRIPLDQACKRALEAGVSESDVIAALHETATDGGLMSFHALPSVTFYRNTRVCKGGQA
jgi:hypothetical protein